MRSSQCGSAQARWPSTRSKVGISSSRISTRVEQDGDAEDDPHLLRRQRPGEDEGEEDEESSDSDELL